MTIQLPKKIKITFKGAQAPYRPAALEYLKRQFNFRTVKATQDPYVYCGCMLMEYKGTHNDVVDAIIEDIYIDIYIDDGIPYYIRTTRA